LHKKSGPIARAAFLKFADEVLEPATAITTVSAAPITTTAAAAATFTAATATTAAVSTAATATTTAAAFALFHGTRFIDGQGSAIDFLAMKFGNSGLRFFRGAHFHESETTGTARDAVVNHLDPGDVARLGKEIGQVVFCHAKGQIAHIEFYAHLFFSLMAR
jgi:hypothetical protein